ncbi:MAG: hypothetical protein ACK4VI_07435 [Alphaproteobacteria bacterium]
MRIKTLAVATGLALLSSSALMSSATMAQKGITLQPQTAWAVKRVNENRSDAYCALARRFNNNLILTLAKNDRNETSLALDFTGVNFQTGQNYTITLDPGAGGLQSYDVSPTSPQAFVLRIGNNAKFMDALSKTGYLRVELDGETYGFNLADIDDGQTQLKGCLLSAMTPAAGDESVSEVSSVSAVSVAESRGDIASIQAQKNALEVRLKALEAENSSLRQASDLLRQEIEAHPVSAPLPLVASDIIHDAPDATSSNSASEVQAVEDNAKIRALVAQIQSLQSENSELQRLVEASKETPLSEQSTDISVVELARENERLQSLLNEQKKAPDLQKEIESLTQKISRLENDNIDLSRQLSQATVDGKGDLEKKIVQLQSENENLREGLVASTSTQSDYEILRQEIQSLESANQSLNDRISDLMAERGQLSEQLSFYESENDSLKSASVNVDSSNESLLAQLRQDIQSMEIANASLLAQKESDLLSLKAELDSLKSEKAHLHGEFDLKALQLEADFKAQIENLNQRNVDLEQDLSQISAENDSINELKSKLSEVLAEKEGLETRINEAASLIQSMEEKISAQDASGQSIIENLQAEVSALEEKVAAAENEKSSLKEEIDQFNTQNNTLSETLAQFENDLKAAKSENAELKQQILQSDIADSNSAEELQKVLAENEKLREEIEKISQKGDQASLSISELEASLVAESEKNKQLQAEFTEKLFALKEQSEALLKDAYESRKQLDVSANEAESELRARIAELETQLLETHEISKNELAELVAENEKLQEQYQSQIASINDEKLAAREEFETRLAELQTEKDALVVNYQEQSSEIEKSLRSELAEALAEIAALNDVASEIEGRNLRLTETLDTLRNDYAVSLKEIDELKQSSESFAELSSQELNSLRLQYEAAQRENEDLKLALDNEQSFNLVLQSDWQNSGQALERLRKENAEYKALAEGYLAELETVRASYDLQIAGLEEANEALRESLVKKQAEYVSLYNDFTALKEEQKNGQMRALSVSASKDELEEMRLRNMALEQELEILRQQMRESQRTAIQEVSAQPAVQRQPAASASVVKQTASSQQAPARAQPAQAGVYRVEEASDRDAAAMLAEIEPAAGDVPNTADISEDSPMMAAEQEYSAPEEPVQMDLFEAVDPSIPEAQRLEMSMKRDLATRAPIATSEPELESESVSVSASQDRDIEIVPLSEPTATAASAPTSTATPVVAAASVTTEEPKASAIPQTAEASPPAIETQQQATFSPQGNDVRQLISSAKITSAANVSLVEEHSGADRAAYQWRAGSGGVFGSAKQTRIHNTAEFDTYVRDYLTMTQQRCSGDFAVIPASTSEMGQVRIDSYEVACVGAGINSSASIVFFNRDGVFTAIAHEAPTQMMEAAMDASDRVIQSVKRI